MRLSTFQHQAIKKYFLEVFKEGQIYLFGSRVDESKRGGDIDLYIQTVDKKNLMRKKLDFLVKLKREIGLQKIDVVFDKGLHRAIDKVAMQEGIRL
jgi:predicted nucleotidyltransferase